MRVSAVARDANGSQQTPVARAFTPAAEFGVAQPLGGRPTTDDDENVKGAERTSNTS
jgi:hypothetical protein